MSEFTKKPHAKTSYNQEELFHLTHSQDDPFYFIENFLKVQHSTKGTVPLKLFPFQRRLITAFHTYNKVIALTGRQQGKCVTYDTTITKDGEQVQIGKLIPLTFVQRIVHWLEQRLLKLALDQSANNR